MTLAELQFALAAANVAEHRVRFLVAAGIFEAKLIVHAGERTRVVKVYGDTIETAIKGALAQLTA